MQLALAGICRQGLCIQALLANICWDAFMQQSLRVRPKIIACLQQAINVGLAVTANEMSDQAMALEISLTCRGDLWQLQLALPF
jgi:hypothetical protein